MSRRWLFWLGFLSSAAALASFSDIGEDLNDTGWPALELSIAAPIQALRTPLLTKSMLAMTALGSFPFFIALTLIVLLVPWLSRRDKAAFVGLGISVGLANQWLKGWFGRPRPGIDYNPLVEEPYSSFPSGHSMSSLVLYGFLAYLAVRRKRRDFAALCLFLIPCIGLSRIYLAAHYPADVLGGFIAGWPTLWLALFIHSAPSRQTRSPSE